jgi:hypothetical protein
MTRDRPRTNQSRPGGVLLFPASKIHSFLCAWFACIALSPTIATATTTVQTPPPLLPTYRHSPLSCPHRPAVMGAHRLQRLAPLFFSGCNSCIFFAVVHASCARNGTSLAVPCVPSPRNCCAAEHTRSRLHTHSFLLVPRPLFCVLTRSSFPSVAKFVDKPLSFCNLTAWSFLLLFFVSQRFGLARRSPSFLFYLLFVLSHPLSDVCSTSVAINRLEHTCNLHIICLL